MNISNRMLQLEHLDKKLNMMKQIGAVEIPSKGWFFTIRNTLNMSLKQLGKKLGITAQSVKEIEEREQSRSITLKNLSEAAEALDMRLVYGLVPKNESLKKMIEDSSYKVAKQIVMRASHSMSLEDQENRPERIEQAIIDKANEIAKEIPKYLWD